jgi:hypothetical protein
VLSRGPNWARLRSVSNHAAFAVKLICLAHGSRDRRGLIAELRARFRDVGVTSELQDVHCRRGQAMAFRRPQRVTNGLIAVAIAPITAGESFMGGRFLPVTSSNIAMMSCIVWNSLAKM